MTAHWSAGLGPGLLRPVGSLLSPGGHRARLSILIYHRVLERVDPLCPMEVDAAKFRWQMRLLSTHMRVLPLTEAVQRLAMGSLPARAVCVTFDDGYANNAEVALPILRETGVPATFFVATGYLNGGRMWNDTVIEVVRRFPDGPLDLSALGLGTFQLQGPETRVQAIAGIIGVLKYVQPDRRAELTARLAERLDTPLPDDLMMSDSQVRDLHAAGMEIGGHTVWHPILARVDEATARREIQEGKERLEGLIGERIQVFAYPNGRPGQDYRPRDVALVKKLGFTAAVSTVWGVSARHSDRWQLPRFTPWDSSPLRFMGRLLWNYRNLA